MICSIFSFTHEASKLVKRLTERVGGSTYTSKDILPEVFDDSDAIIFVCATGIAMRLVAPLLKDKLTDPAIIVIDELGQFVIPLASGHVGGANALSRDIAEYLGAIPVITTATDIHGIIAIDEWATQNDLTIINRKNISKISKKLLLNQPVNMSVSDDVVITTDESEVSDDELGLIFKPIVIGMGCKKDKCFAELMSFLEETIKQLEISKDKILAIASIDIKKNEPGLMELAESLGVPFVTYSAEELKEVQGDFEASDFVEQTVGVSDVSARAAKLCGKRGQFILKKEKKDGMTISVFEKSKRLTLDYEKA